MNAAGPPAAEEITRDTLLRGRVTLFQPARGFRSSLDPLLLAAFIRPPFGRFMDLGCGTGALALSMLARDPHARALGVEIQPRLALLAARGGRASGFGPRFAVCVADVRAVVPPDPPPAARFDLIATNPPYRPLGKGVVPPNGERAIAHHEVRLSLREWVAAAARALTRQGRLAVVFPASRFGELRHTLYDAGLGRLRGRFVHPAADAPAGRVLVEAAVGQGSFHEEPALVVHAPGGGFTAEARAIVGDGDVTEAPL